jgi:hypothetical protein
MKQGICWVLVVVAMAGGREALAGLRLNDWRYSATGGTGHLYARTDSGKTWQQADAEAVKVGARLVTVNTAAEHAFLRGYPYYGNCWIGFTDKDSEGTWSWVAGDAGATYVNWAAGEPNGGDAEDYAYLDYTANAWKDLGSMATARGIVEFSKTISDPGSATWRYRPGTGLAYAVTPTLPWEMAQGVAQMWGGNLASVANAEVNTYLQTTFVSSGSKWIGLNDRDSEGAFVWSSGSTAAYRNWQAGEPTSSTDENYVELGDNGTWSNSSQATELQGIVERQVSHQGWLYNKNTGHFYSRLDTTLNWADSETRAQELGGHLTTINNAAENDWVALCLGSGWIGYQDVWQSGDSGSDPPGRWVWADGDSSTFVGWKSGEPNNAGAAEDHAELNPTYNGTTGKTNGLWNDANGVSTLRNGLVERTTKPDDFPTAPTKWLQGPDGLFYALSPTRMTWEQANSVGEYYGFTLASIHSQAMLDWLMANLRPTESVWLGLTDREATSAQEPAAGWQWIDGSPLDFTRWNTGEPNGNRGENYGTLYTSGYWNDLASSGSYLYALYSVPEPATGVLWALGALVLIPVWRRSLKISSRSWRTPG